MTSNNDHLSTATIILGPNFNGVTTSEQRPTVNNSHNFLWVWSVCTQVYSSLKLNDSTVELFFDPESGGTNLHAPNRMPEVRRMPESPVRQRGRFP